MTQPVAVFDIGGTWFRRGLYDPQSGSLEHLDRQPAISFRARPDAGIEELQEGLVGYLVDETRTMAEQAGRQILRSSLSVGAALNGRSGEILGSGPLWGPSSRPMQLQARLEAVAPEVRWTVVNDVTAALLRVSTLEEMTNRDLCLLTISTGIAARWLRGADRGIELDPICGLQGEIGHIPVAFVFQRQRHDRTCDCGGLNHLNAFASGRGLENILSCLPPAAAAEIDRTAGGPEGGQQPALPAELLRAATEPLAQIILTMLATKPALGRLYLTGGVIHGRSGSAYLDALRTNLEAAGPYKIGDRCPTYFDDLLRFAPADDASGLIGAGLAAARRPIAGGPLGD